MKNNSKKRKKKNSQNKKSPENQVLQDSDTLTIRLLPAQKQFIHIPIPNLSMIIDCYQGGYGSGKSYIGALRGLILCQKYPGIRGLVCAKTRPMVQDTILKTYFDHFHALNWTEGKEYIWRVSELRLTFPMWTKNGQPSEIIFRQADQPYKLKSLNIAWAHIEEMSEVGENIFKMLLSRLRQEGYPRYYLFGTTNPQPVKGWIYKYFVRNASKENLSGQREIPAELKDINPTLTSIEYRRIIAPTTENIYLSKAYIENMANQFDPDYYRINVLGQDGDYTAGLVCKTWSSANIDESIAYNPELRIYLFCDFNVDPMCWVCFHRVNNEFLFFDEVVLENTTTVEATETFFRRYEGHQNGVIIGGDASGDHRSTQSKSALDTNYTIMRNRLSQLGMRNVQIDLHHANPTIQSRIEAWNAAVCNSQGIRRVKAHPRCQHLIENCENLKYLPGDSRIWEPTPQKIQLDPKLKFVKHIWDAASYAVEKYAPIRLEQSDSGKSKHRVRLKSFRPKGKDGW